MSENMMERVARAIDDASDEVSIAFLPPSGGPDDPAVERCRLADREKRFRQARAVIAAMREPTNDMMDVYKRAFVSEKRFDGREVYGAMIDAALTPAKVDEAG